MWLADRAREAGLEPAGDDGTYFQYFPLERFRVSEGSRVELGGSDLRIGTDVIPSNRVLARVDAPIAIVEDAAAVQRAGASLSGRVVVARYAPTETDEGDRTSLTRWARALQQGMDEGVTPAAVVVLVPSDETDQWAQYLK